MYRAKLTNIIIIARCNIVCKFRYNFGFLNTETFYSQLHNVIQVKKYYVFQKLFEKLLKVFHVNEIFFNVALYKKKPSCIMPYLNLDIIDVLFEYSNTPFFKIKSHVLSYLEIKYFPHHSLIKAVNLQR